MPPGDKSNRICLSQTSSLRGTVEAQADHMLNHFICCLRENKNMETHALIRLGLWD